MPLRVLLILVLIFVLLRFLGQLVRVVAAAMAEGAGGLQPSARAGAGPGAIALVRCRRCGVFVPQGKAQGSGDATLCTDCAGR